MKLRLRMSEWTPEDSIALRWDGVQNHTLSERQNVRHVERLTCPAWVLTRVADGLTWVGCVWVADKELPAPEEVVSAQIGAPHYVGDVRNRLNVRPCATV